jgi:MurNAc alpha-1-phosphate uridylyltransferase
MIFAAGLGTRLGALTEACPKALVEVDGRPLLMHVLERLAQAGFTDVIVNIHHFADRIKAWLAAHDCGMEVVVSREDVLLDTGGGLKKAAWFFESEERFLVHNVDVLSDIDLSELVGTHDAVGGLATLAVMRRPSSRYLLLDEAGLLCGRRFGEDGEEDLRRKPEGALEAAGFCGIHVVADESLGKLPPVGRYSITDAYLDLVEAGAEIRTAWVDGAKWRDCGRPEDLMPL